MVPDADQKEAKKSTDVFVEPSVTWFQMQNSFLLSYKYMNEHLDSFKVVNLAFLVSLALF